MPSGEPQPSAVRPVRRIVLATRNAGKAREIRAMLLPTGVDPVSLAEVDPGGAIAAPPETAESFAANARAKAAYYARATGGWALADDSGLEVDALAGAPGTRSARYADGEIPPQATKAQTDAANNARLLRQLADVPDPQRTARFVCHLAVSDGGRILLEARGTVAGRIARTPAGSNGFGYDPLFFLPQLGCTVAQLPAEEKNRISHRGRAVRQLAKRLKELLDGRGGPGGQG